jgi:CHAT domain-containing protein/Tfp pilus assembly protein PilF
LWQAGEFRKALKLFEEALDTSTTVGQTLGAASALHNIGILYDSLGRHEDALQAYDRAIAFLRELGPSIRFSSTLHNIGVAYLSLGRLPEAFDYLQRALEMNRRFENLKGQAANLSALGRVRSAKGDEEGALLDFEVALELRQATGDPLGKAATLDHQGTSYHNLERHTEALRAYRAALALLRTTGNRLNIAHTLANLGTVYLALDNPHQALIHDRRALELFREIGDLQGEATSLVAIAQVEQRRGNLWAAKSQLEGALQLVETVRAQLQGSAFRRSYLATHYGMYDAYITLLMELDAAEPDEGHGIHAFEAAERVRARVLQEGLARNHHWRLQAAPELRQREEGLRQRIQELETRRRDLASVQGPTEVAKNLEQEIEGLLVEYLKLDGALRRSAGSEAVAPIQAVEFRAIQTSLLDHKTTLLAYHLGEVGSFLWVVSRQGFSSHRLPPRALLETAVYRVRKGLSEGGQPKGSPEFLDKAKVLSQLVLGPALSELAGERLVILANGILTALPFSALPLPTSSPNAMYVPLIERFEVVHLPSATVLALIRQRQRRKPKKTLAMFADPVFALGAPEPPSPSPSPSPSTSTSTSTVSSPLPSSAEFLTHAARNSGFGRLRRLPFARREAEAILSLVEDPNSRFSALGFEATRRAVLTENLSQYRLLHFATHGFLNDRHASLSGIVLSLVDAKGQSLDGFLRVHEIERLELTANLVVLSACRTALGKTIRGEGIVGLSQAFFLAGAQALVVSHWDVDDEATAILMKRLYTAMLGDEALAPAAALRVAQNSIRKDSSWKSPYFWAAFTFQGDWQPR